MGDMFFVFPIVVISILAFIIYNLVKLVIGLKIARSEYRLNSVHDVINIAFTPLLSIIMTASFLAFSIWPTFRYQMYLPFESEEKACTFYGKIDGIQPAPSMKYHVGDETYSTPGLFYSGDAKRPPLGRGPSILKSDDKEFYIINAEGVREGMWMKITYLPRSHMVLDCVQIDGEGRQ